MKKLLLILLVLICVPLVSGLTALDNVGGCKPPIDYAKSNECDLIRTGSIINKYYCDDMIIRSDCDGNVYYEEERATFEFTPGTILFIIGDVIFIIIILFFIHRFIDKRNRKKVGEIKL